MSKGVWVAAFSVFLLGLLSMSKTVRTSVASMAADLIAKLEGFSPTPYKDIAGRWTIGYGHLMQPGEPFTAIDHATALQLLQQDMASASAAVDSLVSVPLTPQQHAALVSFTYNVGVDAFRNSTLLRLLNAGDMQGAAQQFLVWDKYHSPAGQLLTSPGLLARRQTEQQMFLS